MKIEEEEGLPCEYIVDGKSWRVRAVKGELVYLYRILLEAAGQRHSETMIVDLRVERAKRFPNIALLSLAA